MKKNNVNSSVISSIAYDGFSSVLTVTIQQLFKKKSVYQYANVPKNVYQNFKRCKSKGKFFSTKIVGKYQTRQVNAEAGLVEELIRELDAKV